MIVIGDVHGNFDTLMALLDKIPQEEKDKGICFVGDLIDRGPKSMQVVDWVMSNNVDCVTGNHEVIMVKGVDRHIKNILQENRTNMGRLSDPDIWMINGGIETLHSYMSSKPKKHKYVISKDKIDLKKIEVHREWMQSLPFYKEYENVQDKNGRKLVVSHSAIGKAWRWSAKRRQELEHQFINQCVWSRPRHFHDNLDIYNIFGHTPISGGPRIKSFYANVDTGCFYNDPEYFRLTAVQFPEMVVYEQKCIDTPIYEF